MGDKNTNCNSDCSFQIILANAVVSWERTGRMYSRQLGGGKGWGRQVCLSSLRLADLAKLFRRLQFALLSVPGFQNHTLCSLCCDLVLLSTQECCRGFTAMNISARLDRACYPTWTFKTGYTLAKETKANSNYDVSVGRESSGNEAWHISWFPDFFAKLATLR